MSFACGVMTRGFSTMPEPFVIAPETEDAVNYHAFKDNDSCLRLFPQDIAHRLKDESSVENRKIALTTIHQAILSCENPAILTESLQKIVILVTMPLNDPNIKIVLSALQILDDLVGKVQNNISPHLDHILTIYLERIACSKYNVKQAGMKLLLHLVSVVSFMKVIEGVMDHGLLSKKSKIREETLNIITVMLLRFPDAESDLATIIKRISPLLADSRQNVRQAGLETCMVLCKCLGAGNLQQLVSAVTSVAQTIQKDSSKPSLVEALEARLNRSIFPLINSDGLLEHAVNVASGKNTDTGADVDWILAGAGKSSSSPGVGGRKISTSGSGPLRSAGKKLPWDPKEEKSSKLQPQQHSSYSTIYQDSLSNVSKPSLIIPSPRQKGYLDLYHSRSTMRSSISTDVPYFKQMANNPAVTTAMHHLQHRESVLPNGMVEVSCDSEIFATTWPRSNGYYSSFMKTTSRQISADTGAPVQTSQSRSSSNTLPAIGGRPPSKPLVRNLFPPPQPAPPTGVGEVPVPPFPFTVTHSTTNNSGQIEKSFLGGQLEEDDQEYFNIPVDDSLLNSSLSSSVSSLCAAKDLQSSISSKKKIGGTPAVDLVGQTHTKAVATWKTEALSTQYSTSTSPVGTPPLVSGPSPQKSKVASIASAPNATKISSQESLSKKHLTSPPRFNGYSKKHQSPRQIDDETESLLNRTFTISPPEKRGAIAASKEPASIKASLYTASKPKGKVNSYAEAAALRKTTKLLSSPEHEPFSKKPTPLNRHTHNFVGGTYVSDMELTATEYSHTQASYTRMNPGPSNQPPSIQKTKKQSPPKNAVSPLKAGRQSLSPISAACSSAPVYRTAPDTPTIQDESLVELEPHPNPDLAMKELFEDLESGSEEWERKCKGLLTIRRLAAYNKEVLLSQLQQIVLMVIQEVKNLRSQVARGAIACLGDMFAFIGRDMEQSLDMVVKTMLQVGSKSNNFFREDVEKAMNEMIAWINPGKCVSSLLNGGLGHNSNTVRRLLGQYLHSMVHHHGADKILKQLSHDVLERLLSALVSLLSDADVGARYHSKKSVNELCCHPEFEHIASKCLSRPQFLKVKETVEILRTKGVGKPPPELYSAKQSVGGGHYSNRSVTAPTTGPSPPSRPETNYMLKVAVRKRRVSANVSDSVGGLVSPVEVQLPEGLLVKMGANDWNDRNQAVTELEKFIISHPSGLGSSITKVFDVFNQRLTDQNSKVNLHALESFQRFVPLIGPQIHPVLSTLVEALVRTVASRYPTIHSAAINAMETLIGSVDHTLILTPLSSAAQNGNTRVQPFMLRKLADILPGVYQQKPSLVQRVGLPVLWKVLSSRSPATGEARAALQCLCKSLLLCLGSDRLESSMAQQPPDQQQKLKDILRNLQPC